MHARQVLECPRLAYKSAQIAANDPDDSHDPVFATAVEMWLDSLPQKRIQTVLGGLHSGIRTEGSTHFGDGGGRAAAALCLISLHP